MKLLINSLILGFLVMSATVQADKYHSFDNGHSNAETRYKSIVGSWEATIDFFGTPFRALYSFQKGGTLTESDNPGFDPNFGSNALSPGLGAWVKTSRRKFSAKYRKLAYDTYGELQAVYTSRMDLKLKKDGTISGTLNIEVRLPDGTVINEIPDIAIVATGIRID